MLTWSSHCWWNPRSNLSHFVGCRLGTVCTCITSAARVHVHSFNRANQPNVHIEVSSMVFLYILADALLLQRECMCIPLTEPISQMSILRWAVWFWIFSRSLACSCEHIFFAAKSQCGGQIHTKLRSTPWGTRCEKPLNCCGSICIHTTGLWLNLCVDEVPVWCIDIK